MGAKIAVFILTTAVCLAAAVVLFFGMILAMNGYSESDAIWGMIVYAALAVFTAIIAGGGAVYLYGLFAAKYGAIRSALIAIPVSSLVGIVIETLCSVVGILVAEFVRVNF
ncbi:MAG: hypothetical protein QM785_02770 [Pyrinomonadaceae bacterium]